jgi:hypothetical protein
MMPRTSPNFACKPSDAAPNCEKCGEPTNLVTIIGRLGNIPTYRVFQCDACKALQWVAEQITGDGDTA